LVFGASIRAGSRRVGNIDIALLAANRRLTIEGRKPRWTKSHAKPPRPKGFSGDCPLRSSRRFRPKRSNEGISIADLRAQSQSQTSSRAVVLGQDRAKATAISGSCEPVRSVRIFRFE
jgi:hypothetical protein